MITPLKPVNKLIYVTNNDAGAILTLNSDTKIVVGSPIPVGDNPLTVLFNPDDTNMYVTANFSKLSVIDSTKNTVIGNLRS